MPVQPSRRLVLAALTVLLVASCSQNQYFATADDSIGPVCVHLNMPYSDRICPDSTPSTYFKPAEVIAETLVVHTSDGRNIRIAVPPRTDAIFLTHSAMSTFLVRHYDATNPERAAETRALMERAYRR